MLKKVVVFVKSGIPNYEEFKTQRDYLAVHNKDNGQLIINDVSEDKDTKNKVIDTLATFADGCWDYWRVLDT